jgi:protein-S-isoprenylcysteine O-methyltransferase Ste14
MGWCQFALLISIQTRYEEEALIKAHGDRYIEYAAKVGRFFLNVGTFAPNAPEII